MPHSRHTRMMFVGALLAAATLGACGGDDNEPVEATVVTTAPVTETQPAATTGPRGASGTTTDGAAPAKPKAPAAKVIKVNAKPQSLSAGGLKVAVQVDSVIDPVVADVDEPQEGGRFIGVFLNTRASGKYEPSKVTAVASLTTESGKSYPVRVISGGECEGAFFPAGLVLKSAKTRLGCIGFDIPKSEQPKEIVLGVRSTVSNDQDTATWALPDAT